jgi:spoIIIJ-associated protein
MTEVDETTDGEWSDDDLPRSDAEADDSSVGAKSSANASPEGASDDDDDDDDDAPDDDDDPIEPDDRATLALDFVTDVVEQMGMECTVELRRPKSSSSPEEIAIEISGKDAGRVIGKKGAVLQALQFLAHRAVNRPGLERRHILVDAEGYRSRRDSSLSTMAQRLGKQAVEQGKIITFEPMNPRDRRVVHLALAKFEGVITKSDGEGDDRRVQIIPVRR